MPDEEINNPFDTNSDTITLTPEDLGIAVNKVEDTKDDPAIEEKDKKIEEGKVDTTITKTDEPEKTPTATPKDIPARTEKEKEDIIPATELKFANETSEKIFNLLKEGKEEEVYDFLNKKKTLSNIDKLPATDIIKLQLKNENKDYSQEDIEDVFNDKFAKPEQPTQEIDEDDEAFAKREGRYKKQVEAIDRKIEREAKSSKSELLKLQQELVLPEIPKPEAKAKEPTQEELEAQTKARESYLNSIDTGLDAFSSIDVTFKDKDVEIPVSYKISAEERKELKSQMENFNLEDFIKNRWLTEDGKFNTAQQAKDLLLLTKGDAVLGDLVNKIGNKRYAEAKKEVKNINYSGNAGSKTLEPDLVAEQNKMADFFFSN